MTGPSATVVDRAGFLVFGDEGGSCRGAAQGEDEVVDFLELVFKSDKGRTQLLGGGGLATDGIIGCGDEGGVVIGFFFESGDGGGSDAGETGSVWNGTELRHV